MVSPFEAPVGSRRLLGPREPADGLQRRARPPGLPRPLASSLSPPASYPSKSTGGVATDPVGLPEQAEWGGERGGERGEREGEELGHPWSWPASLAPKAHPLPGVELHTKAPRCHANSRRGRGEGGGGGKEASRPSLEKGSFLFCPRPLHAHSGSSQPALCVLPSPSRA